MSGLVELQARVAGEILAILKKEIADAVADGVRRALTELRRADVPDAPPPSSREPATQATQPVQPSELPVEDRSAAMAQSMNSRSGPPSASVAAAKPRKNPPRFCAECNKPIGAFSTWCRDCYRGGAPKTREVIAATKPAVAPAPPAPPAPVERAARDPFPVTVAVRTPPKLAPYVPQRADAPSAAMRAPVAPEQPEPASARTAEREDRLRRGLTAGDGIGLILAILNSYPGPKLLQAELVAWIAEIGAEAPGIQPPPDGHTKRTAGRRNVLIAAYENGDPVANIRQKLNMLSGPALDNNEVEAWAKDLLLKRPQSYNGGRLDPEKGSPMDWNSALSWALRYGLKFRRGAKLPDHHRVINEKRAAMGLNPWRITEPRGEPRRIPENSLFGARASAEPKSVGAE